MKILVIQNRMGIGDMIMFLPFIKAISNYYGEQVSLMVKKSTKASEYLNEEIRLGKISREEAAKIVQKYDGKYSNKIIKDFCNFIEISPKLFWQTVKKNTNRKLFKISGKKIKPKFMVGKNFR